MSRPILTESQIKRIIQQELYYRSIVQEGLWDDVKSGAKKLISNVTKQVAGTGLAKKAKEVMSSFTKLPDEVTQVVSATKKAMQQTGETIKADDGLKAAKELGQITPEKMGAILASDLKGPVHDKAAKLTSEGLYHEGLTPILNEINVGLNQGLNSKNSLNEAGVLGMLGLGLAGFGGTIFLLRALEKLAKYLGAEKTANIIHKAHHTLHHIEEKAIDVIIPDNVSYLVYKMIRARGIHFQTKHEEPLTKEEYMNNFAGVKSKVEKLIYSAFLVFLAFEGVKAAIHAGASLIGFAEGTASVIKGAEIGQAAAHIGDIIELGIEEIEDYEIEEVEPTKSSPPPAPSKR